MLRLTSEPSSRDSCVISGMKTSEQMAMRSTHLAMGRRTRTVKQHDHPFFILNPLNCKTNMAIETAYTRLQVENVTPNP
jgi:hypothetical protein